MNIRVLCECNSFDCKWVIDLSYEENLKAHQNGSMIIINGCSQGPDPTDILVEKKDKYSIYREG